MHKSQILKFILWFFIAFGCVTAILRLINGLGATTGLTDSNPWGFWIGFDVMAGVALAAGGFVLAAIVHVFHLEQFKPIVRPAVLTAFLGYVIVAIGLMLDLGLPWNIWHPMVFWQHHSVLFEVGVCVMLYLTVLLLEVAPVILEYPLFSFPLFKNLYQVLKRFTIPLVILGIMLSTLHQSSLGSLFLIMPFRVHELWYTPNIYILYFISAVALGCSMVIFESTLTALIYDHKPKLELLRALGKIASGVLALYVVVRLGDIIFHGKFPAVFEGSGPSILFITEILISGVIPMILFNLKAVNSSTRGVFLASAMVVFGFVMNRQDIFLTMSRKGPLYFPWFSEIMISVALVSGATMVFIFFVEHFDLFGEGLPSEKAEIGTGQYTGPFFGSIRSFRKGMAAFSVPVVLGVGASLVTLPSSAITGYQYPNVSVKASVGWDTLIIDGNKSREKVLFPHLKHQELMGSGRDACTECHHMSKPGDGPTSCSECHMSMYNPYSIFNHNFHQNLLGGNTSCATCHFHSKAREDVISCGTAGCHKGMLSSDTSLYVAPSFVDAMHEKCKTCHDKVSVLADSLEKSGEHSKALSAQKLGLCTSCHAGLDSNGQY